MLFPPDEDLPLPCICYYEGESTNMYADGKVYFQIMRYTVEFYSDKKDFDTEKLIEEKLSDVKWTKNTVWVEDERCFLTTYEMEV